jgi:hypothetical protein
MLIDIYLFIYFSFLVAKHGNSDTIAFELMGTIFLLNSPKKKNLPHAFLNEKEYVVS